MGILKDLFKANYKKYGKENEIKETKDEDAKYYESLDDYFVYKEISKDIIIISNMPYYGDNRIYGVWNKGKITIEMRYNNISINNEDSDDLEFKCYNKINNEIEYLDKDGNKIKYKDYKIIYKEWDSSEYVLCEKDGKRGFLDRDENIIVPVEYSNVMLMRGNNKFCFVLYSENEVGLFDMEIGKEVIPCNYSSIGLFIVNLFTVTDLNGNMSLYDILQQKELIPFHLKYNNISVFNYKKYLYLTTLKWKLESFPGN